MAFKSLLNKSMSTYMRASDSWQRLWNSSYLKLCCKEQSRARWGLQGDPRACGAAVEQTVQFSTSLLCTTVWLKKTATVRVFSWSEFYTNVTDAEEAGTQAYCTWERVERCGRGRVQSAVDLRQRREGAGLQWVDGQTVCERVLGHVGGRFQLECSKWNSQETEGDFCIFILKMIQI